MPPREPLAGQGTCDHHRSQPAFGAFIGGVATSVLDTVSDMDHNDVDPTEHPDYLTLSDAGKECGVSTKVVQKLVRERKIVEGVARTQRGTPTCIGNTGRAGRRSRRSSPRCIFSSSLVWTRW